MSEEFTFAELVAAMQNDAGSSKRYADSVLEVMRRVNASTSIDDAVKQIVDEWRAKLAQEEEE